MTNDHPPRPAYPGGASGLLAAGSGVSFVLLRELRSEPKSILPQIQVLTLSTPSLKTWIPDKPDINIISVHIIFGLINALCANLCQQYYLFFSVKESLKLDAGTFELIYLLVFKPGQSR